MNSRFFCSLIWYTENNVIGKWIQDQEILTNVKKEFRQLKENIVRFSKTFGPGILFASTAIGVSHLVQSTRAGAEYGFLLLGFVILATVLKYPFFEYGSRYANVTGTSIIDGFPNLL